MADKAERALFGLEPETLRRLCGVLRSESAVDKVILYGSRATGTFQNGSDIDVTLVGFGLTDDDLRRLLVQVDDLLLPYKVDLSIWAHIDNPALLDHIRRVGVEICDQ
ncbi:MAG: nucleotidyltransferase domain-containing protein [Alkalispirochaeta sp.]|jgi:predicted nucleotidyltransferase